MVFDMLYAYLMKNRLFITMLILLCACSAHAQDTVKTSYFVRRAQAHERRHQQRVAEKQKVAARHRRRGYFEPEHAAYHNEDSATRALFAQKFMVRVTPTSLVDFNGACLPVGIEYHFKNSLGIAVEVSVPMPYEFNAPVVRNNVSGKTINSDFKLRLEVRRYFIMRRSRRVFFGVEAYMRQQQFSQANGYYDGPRVFHVYNYTSADITKFHAGIAPFIGSSFKLADHLFFDAHFGIGLRYLENKYSHINGLTQGGRNSMGALFVPEDELYGHMWRPYIAAGLKLGYIL